MIDGVVKKKLRLIADERGWLMEILRNDWVFFEKFGQVYLTTAYPKVVKAWHMHHRQIDNITCVKGTMKLVLYDDRKKSKTFGEINEFILGKRNPLLIKVPNFVWHGFTPIGNEIAFFINAPTELYDYDTPDEHRLPPNTDKIPYNWNLDPNMVHG